jgi:inorganic pyrophosphatase
MHLLRIPIGKKAPKSCNAVIEVPHGSNNKYELDKETGAIHLDRVLHSPFFYPADYGFFPETLCDDGDPLDVLVLIREPTFPGVVVSVRPIGYMMMQDEKGMDEKVIAVAEGDPWYRDFKDVSELPKNMTKSISHFFEEYKKNESNKWAKVGGWHGHAAAEKLIAASMQAYKKASAKK